MIFNIEFNKTSHLYTCLRLKVKPKTSNSEFGRKKTLSYPRRVYTFRVGRKEYIFMQNLCYRRLDVSRYLRIYSSHKLWNIYVSYVCVNYTKQKIFQGHSKIVKLSERDLYQRLKFPTLTLFHVGNGIIL